VLRPTRVATFAFARENVLSMQISCVGLALSIRHVVGCEKIRLTRARQTFSCVSSRYLFINAPKAAYYRWKFAENSLLPALNFLFFISPLRRQEGVLVELIYSPCLLRRPHSVLLSYDELRRIHEIRFFLLFYSFSFCRNSKMNKLGERVSERERKR
jgi:hypothetical protein